MKKLLILIFILTAALANADTTDLKTGAQLTYQVPLYNPAGTGDDAYGRYTISDLIASFGLGSAAYSESSDFAPALGVDDNYVTDAEKIVIGNTSGTNTGDQNLSAYLTSTTAASTYFTLASAGTAAATDATAYATAAQGSLANSALQPADVATVATTGDYDDLVNQPTISAAAIGLGNVDNTSDANKPVSTATQTALNLKANTADLGAASALGATNGTIGDVVVWVDDGSGNAALPIDVEGAEFTPGASGMASTTVNTAIVEAYNNGGGSGDIEGVTAGTGLSGGGTTGTITITADSTYLQRRVSASCSAGSSIRAIAEDGTVTCETDDTAAGAGYVATPPTYSDESCTAGQYSLGLSPLRQYLCFASGDWNYVDSTGLVDWDNATPATYSLTVDMVDGNGTDLFTYDSTDYTTDQTFTGLSADATFTVTPDTGRAIACTGTGLTDNGSGSYTANTDSANVTAVCTSTASATALTLQIDGGDVPFPGAWTVEPGTATSFADVVDDDSDGTYISTVADYAQMHFNMQAPTTCTSVSSVTLHLRMSSPTGDGTIRPRAGTTYSTARETSISSTTPTTYDFEYTTNPENSSPWTCADISSLNFNAGYQTRNTNETILYKLWVTWEGVE